MTDFTMLTYNVWFEKNYFERIQFIAIEIDMKKPDIICLQEIIHTAQTIKCLESIGYMVIISPSTRRYRELIGVRKDSGFIIKKVHSIPFINSVMQRELLIAELYHPEIDTLHIAVSHLESMYQFRKIRLEQLSIVFKLLSEYDNVFFLGDTNLHIDQSLKIPKSWIDCFNEMGCDPNNKYTYDGKTNKHINGKSRKRFDRVFYKSEQYNPIDFKLFGNINPMSDHYGVLVKFNSIDE